MRAIVTNSLSVLGERMMEPLLARPRGGAVVWDADRALGGREREEEEEEEEWEGEGGMGEGAWRTRI